MMGGPTGRPHALLDLPKSRVSRGRLVLRLSMPVASQQRPICVPDSWSMDIQQPEPELLDGLRLEFGDSGQRSVDFLMTAYGLLKLDEELFPRIGAAVAYCLREAMTSVLQSAVVEQPVTWADASRRVVEARERYEQAASLPGEDPEGALLDLLARISELEDFHRQEKLHEQRLIAVMIDRTGAVPLPADMGPVRSYQQLLDRLNTALHGSRPEGEAEQLWSECIAIFRQLFMPPEIRRIELEQLARSESPTDDERDDVCRRLVSPHDLRYFMNKVTSPAWLGVLGPTGVLDPPDAEAMWPAFPGVVRLGRDHHEEVTAWLEEMYGLHGATPRPAWDLARAALDIGGRALNLVLRAVRDHPEHSGILMLGDMAVEKFDASDELVESFADVLLNESSFSRLGYAEPLLRQICAGINEDSANRRVRLLRHKIGTVPDDSYSLQSLRWHSSGSVTDHDQFLGEDRFAALLLCLVDAIKRAWVWVPADELLDLLEGLPEVLVQRLRAWALGQAPNVDPDLLVEEIEQAISTRRPTGDDLALVDRAVKECEPSSYVERWRDALGPAPTIEKAGEASSAETVPLDWTRAVRWCTLLPDEVTAVWATARDIITAPYGPPDRSSLERSAGFESGSEQSPYSPEQLQSMDPDSAASMISLWRPGPDDWLVTAHKLAQTLESVVRDDPQRWLESPVRTVTKLHHPTYISHYLRAVAAVASERALPVGELIDVITLVRTRPWSPVALGDRGDYDSDWTDAQRAAIDLIKATAASGCTFDDRADDMWAILESEVTSCSDTPAPETDEERDPYHSAIDRRCTRALEAVLFLIDREYRATEMVRPQAVSLLDHGLRLTGRDGAEHRAVLASRIGFLRHVLPAWTEDNRDLLFGDQAPDGLGQKTVDQAIKRSYPNDWLLENFQAAVHSAVRREVDDALNHLLVAMLRGIPGYSAQTNVALLRHPPELASRSGEALGRLLSNGVPERRHLQIAAEFWSAMLQEATRDALLGFGWMSRVDAMDSELWADLTLETLRATGDRIDWSHGVAERVAAAPPGRTRLAIMNSLVRDQKDPWGSRRVIEAAVGILDSAQPLAATDEYRRLYRTLLERGAIDA